MKIIDTNINEALTNVASKPIISEITGACRIVGAILQIALNILFSPISYGLTKCGVVKEQSGFHVKNVKQAIYEGFRHFAQGILEMIPGSSLYFGITRKVYALELSSKHHYITYVEGSDPWAFVVQRETRLKDICWVQTDSDKKEDIRPYFYPKV